MQTLAPNSRRSLLILAASYSCIVPFVIVAAIAIFLFVMYQVEVVHNHPTLSRRAYGDILVVPFWILVSSFVSGVVSLFGIPKHGMRPILLKATVGILASCGAGYVVYVLVAMSSIIC